ncbi:hypothetical protein KSP40_PGU010756 [Platanthera guangdongensis]|uniref:Uncharacterized protein n=1 Tax=Platanthera guangdongensis TaxID=2320717 RepID=A0ABR2LQ66_9ASPA
MSANGNKGFLPLFPFSSLALDASSTDNLYFRSIAIGSPPPSLSFSRWNLGPRHILLLNIIACTGYPSHRCRSRHYRGKLPSCSLAVKRSTIHRLFRDPRP